MTYAGKPLYWFVRGHGCRTGAWKCDRHMGQMVRGRDGKAGQSKPRARAGRAPAAEELAFKPRIGYWEAFMSSILVFPRSLVRLVCQSQRRSRERTGRGSSLSRVYLPACSIVGVAAVLVGIGWVESLGWCRLRRLDDESSCHRGRSAHPGDYWGLPHRGAIATGTTATDVRPRLPPRRPLHGAERDARRAARHRVHLSFSEVARKTLPWIVLPKFGTVPRWGAIA